MKILIAGIPGTGKTTMGNFLAEKYGYVHINMEEEHRTSKILNDPGKFIGATFSGNSNIVVTWGFSPDTETINVVNKLRESGFKIFWFDGNRNSSRSATLRRSDFDEQTLQRQMQLLDKWNVPEKIHAKIVDVFDAEGNFRSSVDIAKEIILIMKKGSGPFSSYLNLLLLIIMPRPPRTIEGNTIYHVLNRANARMQIFKKDKDYLAFEKTLLEAREKYPMRILAYCLMPNHWHFVLCPKNSKDLALFMRWLTLTHTQRWLVHRNMAGYGHVYQGRYKSFPVQEDGHFLQVCKYVESNALRAKLVSRAEDWRWGSAWIRKHGNQEQKGLLSKWPVPMTSDYISWLNQRDEDEFNSLKDLRNSVVRGKPFGSESWVEKTAKKFKLESTLNLRGRPRKGT